MDTQPKLSVISGNFRAAGDDSLSPAPSSASSLRGATNPLTSKVTSVLSTSFADSEFRDALALLDARGIKNTPDTRRELRLDLQMEIIDSNAVIVDDFGRVAEQLRLQGAHSQTAQLMDESKVLIEKRQNIETKRELLNKIRDHFILTQDEIDLLSLSSEPVNDLFFAALAKAKVIQKDSEALLGFENQKLGLELMEQVSKHVNMAFQKLYKWLQREFKALNLENPQLHPAIRKAIRVLAERPTLFQNCLDFFADARERILSDSFYTALTGINAAGHQESVSKPIELVAHDSLRYVGDMLAWTHSATVGEKEALEVLFVSEGDEIAKGLESGRKNEIWSLVHDETSNEEPFDARKALNELVDRDIAGASRLLRQRIQQVIQNNEDTILAYKLANLLGFYKAMFSKVLGPNSALIQLIVNLEQEALRQFMTLVRDHIATLQTEFQKTPDDLGPPVFLQEALDQLGVIMETYDSSIDAASDKEKEFEAILTEALNPFTEKKRSETQRDVDSDAATLLESQLSLLKKNSGLQEIFLAVRGLDATDKEAVKSLHRLKPFEPTSLKLARQTLDDFLPSALIDAMEHIKLIRDSKISRQITEDAAEKFCQEFEHLEDVLLADEALFAAEAYDGDIDPFKDLFPRTTGEIRVLLS
ncbi:hypothetical protein CFO_g1316 [Ceratocystis platani]|uniref:Conserved oligomeric Golgi complex subunit 6 n=1 Tax=Ceratocystis fimbriata f. sp. platani TaxID=88771 RepID=A0A0F8B3R3_CERFI|nr:hypothetical protein CFO_g1316 [Ceratocystis platani]